MIYNIISIKFALLVFTLIFFSGCETVNRARDDLFGKQEEQTSNRQIQRTDNVISANNSQTQTSYSKSKITEVQRRLSALGYHLGKIDGIWGPISQESLKSFQRSQNLFETGIIDPASLQSLGLSESDASSVLSNGPGQNNSIQPEAQTDSKTVIDRQPDGNLESSQSVTKVLLSRADLLGSPDEFGQYLGQIPAGASLTIQPINISGFVKVTYQGKTGYIDSTLLSN